jgi:hypothetical protein
MGAMVGMAVGGRDVCVGRGMEVGGRVAVTKSGVDVAGRITPGPSAVQPVPIKSIAMNGITVLKCTGIFYPKTKLFETREMG